MRRGRRPSCSIPSCQERHGTDWLAALATLLLLATLRAAPPAAAQEETPPTLPPAEAAPAGSGAVELLQPDTYLLPDKEGRLQPVLRFPFEEFVEALQIKNGVDGPRRPPPYTIERLEAKGKARAARAELKIECEVALQSDQWVRVPLGMTRVVLRSVPRPKGAAEQALRFEQEQGYVWWVRGEAESSATLTLDAVVPLVQLGGETALRLAAPRAVNSSFELDVPVSKAIGRVSGGASLESSTSVGDGATRLAGLGLDTRFELAWRRPDSPAGRVPTLLEAVGAVALRIDGRSVRSEAELSVRSFGGSFEQFQVRLPPRATLVEELNDGYRVTPARGGTDDRRGQLVTVKLDEKTTGPVSVRLIAEQSRDPAEQRKRVELAGFGVVGAVRQWGHVAVEVVGDWQVLWQAQQNVRQVEDLPEILRRGQLLAGFEYFSQPYTLAAQIVPRESRVRVEPEYLLLVGDRQAVLEGRLRFTVRGAKVFALQVRLPGWALDADGLGPENVVDAGGVVHDATDTVTVPLLQPATGEIELRFRAQRALPPGVARIDLPLPIAQATTQTPATVVVLPDDNVELVPRSDAEAGLTPRPVAPGIALPPREQEPLYFRSEPGTPARFVAELRVYPQVIDVDVDSRVEVQHDAAKVEQTLTYFVSRVPIDRLHLLVPRELAASRELEFLFEDQPLQPVWLTAASEPATVGAARQRRGEIRGGDGGPDEPDRGGNATGGELHDAPGTGDSGDGPEFAARDEADSGDAAVDEPAGTSPDRRDAGQISARLTLPGQRIGRHELRIRYPIELQALLPQQSVPIEIPLVMPADGRLGRNEADVRAADDIELAPRGETWTPPETPLRGPDDPLRLVTEDRAKRLPLAVHLEERATAGSTVIARVWIQSWLTTAARQDRVAIRMTTAEPELLFTLPTGADPAATEVHLDGRLVPASATRDGDLRVTLPAVNAPRRREVQLRYHVALPDRSAGLLAVEAPRLRDSAWNGHVYWQLVLPAGEHLLAAPDRLTREFHWTWHGFHWGRRPLMDQRHLESWSGAPPGTAVPPTTNHYLFSQVSPPSRLAVRTARRGSIVLLGAGGALVAGLLLLYVPWARRGGVLLTAALLLAAAALLYPEPALLVAQTAALGAALGLLAVTLRRLVSRRRRDRLAPGHGSSILLPSRGSTEPYLPSMAASQGGPPSSAATTIALPTSEANR